MELRGWDDLDGPEPESLLHDNRIQDGSLDRHQRLRFEQREPDRDGCGRSHSLLQLQPRLSGSRTGGAIHGHVDRKPDLLAVEL